MIRAALRRPARTISSKEHTTTTTAANAISHPAPPASPVARNESPRVRPLLSPRIRGRWETDVVTGPAIDRV